jgi:methyl-accepting chemotaxis protein
MKISIRTKFTLGMIFFFVIIAGITILSAYQLNRLSHKTDAILKDNHLSVIFARDMAESLNTINQEITRGFATRSNVDSALINSGSSAFKKSLLLEKNNLTEPGEDKLASAIESGFSDYIRYIDGIRRSQISPEGLSISLTKFNTLYQQTTLLSQMNEQAIVLKANDTKKSAENGLTQVTILGTICFIITLSFTFNFASYFNERFTKLYNGIKEIGSKNYDERVYFEGEDEFYDISLVFNEMAKSLKENSQQKATNFEEDFKREININQILELKRTLEQMQDIEEQATNLIAKLEFKEKN